MPPVLHPQNPGFHSNIWYDRLIPGLATGIIDVYVLPQPAEPVTATIEFTATSIRKNISHHIRMNSPFKLEYLDANDQVIGTRTTTPDQINNDEIHPTPTLVITGGISGCQLGSWRFTVDVTDQSGDMMIPFIRARRAP